MFSSISFYLGKDTVVVGDTPFLLGKLSADILNLSPDEYKQMKEELGQVGEYMASYLQTEDVIYWEQAFRALQRLDHRLCDYDILRYIQEPDLLWNVKNLVEKYKQCCIQGFAFDEEERKRDWAFFDRVYAKYCCVLDDIASFNQTIRNFYRYGLRNLKKLDASNYAMALSVFLFDDRIAEKLIANPISGTGLFTNREEVTLRFIPRSVAEGSDQFEIYEYYEVQSLQTLLKMDFYRGLKVGHVIRRCEYCGRYFLLTKGYHTKYCDQPNPKTPQYTCAQLGYRTTGRKEKAGDDPLKQSLLRCYQRLNKDVSRDRLTSEERDALYAAAQDLHFEVRRNPKITFEEFDKMLATKELCSRCGIQRRDGKPGRRKHDQ